MPPMHEMTRREIADQRRRLKDMADDLGGGHRRVALILDLCRVLARLAEDHIEAHPVDACPCKFCSNSEAYFARTSRDVATIAGSASMFADVLDAVVVDSLDDRRPDADPAAELRRQARMVDAE